MQAFILAGGFATRLWPLTEKRAKPLLPLAGKPLLTHLIEKIPEGIPITVSTNQVFAKDFEQWKEAISDKRLAVSILIEDAGHEDEKLGALGAVAKWITENNIQEDVLLLAGDNYIGFSLSEFLAKYNGEIFFATYDLTDIQAAKQFGIVTGENRYAGDNALRLTFPEGLSMVTNFEEKPTNPKSTLISTGCYVFPKDTFHSIVDFAKKHPDNIGAVLSHLLFQKKRKVFFPIHPYSGADWFDIGSFEAYLGATKALVGNDVRRGVACYAPTENNVFAGSIVIGDRSKVQRSTLRNVVLFEDCDIEDCILENCMLDNHCTLRSVDLTGKMLRAGTMLVRKAEKAGR